jgi:hypothetical protein
MVIKNAAGNIIPATYVSANSCFKHDRHPCDACLTAEEVGEKSSKCYAYGNAHKFFNGVHDNYHKSETWCTEYTPGGFAGASVIFALEDSPAAYTLKTFGGASSPKDWTLQRQHADGTWLVISTVTGMASSRSLDVTI